MHIHNTVFKVFFINIPYLSDTTILFLFAGYGFVTLCPLCFRFPNLAAPRRKKGAAVASTGEEGPSAPVPVGIPGLLQHLLTANTGLATCMKRSQALMGDARYAANQLQLNFSAQQQSGYYHPSLNMAISSIQRCIQNLLAIDSHIAFVEQLAQANRSLVSAVDFGGGSGNQQEKRPLETDEAGASGSNTKPKKHKKNEPQECKLETGYPAKHREIRHSQF